MFIGLHHFQTTDTDTTDVIHWCLLFGKILSSTHVQGAQRAELQGKDEIRAIVPVWTAKRGNEGEQDTHLGVVYWAGPQGALQINPSLTRGANHNFKASLCPISPWPWGQTQRQPLRMVSPLDSLEMDAVFLSDMLDVRVLISSAKGENWELGLHLDAQSSQWWLRTSSQEEYLRVQRKAVSLVTAQSSNDYSLFLVFNKKHPPSPLEG